MGRREGLTTVSGQSSREPLRDWSSAARFLGPAYLRYSFTRGTSREVDFLVDALAIEPGARVLDVGCGPGRHSAEFAARGFGVVGFDLAFEFAALAARNTPDAGFAVADARRMPFPAGGGAKFDAVVCLCQGGFGLLAGDDAAVLHEIAGVLGPGGRLALTAFSSYFLVRHLEDRDSFDPATGVNTEITELRNESGATVEFELVTTCFTPRELCLLIERAGLVVDAIWAVGPANYAKRSPDLDHPELLVVASKPGGSMI